MNPLPAKSKTPKILVVDDDAITVQIIAKALQWAGFLTVSAGSVAEALQKAESECPDLILLDVHLPDGNGFEACGKLRQLPCIFQTPVLFISADGDVETKVRGFDVGGVDYITKPLERRELIARVRTHLRLREAYEELSHLQAERIAKLAHTQKSMLCRPCDFPEAHFAVAIEQLQGAGGDFYDVVKVDANSADYLLADASGHDLAAAFWISGLKAMMAQYATPLNLPHEILAFINTALLRILPSGAFFTAVYARWNWSTGRLIVASAGHPPALVFTRGEAKILTLESDVLGAFRDAQFESIEMKLQRGDRFFLYSDGLVETSEGNSDQGLQELSSRLFKGAQQTLPEIVALVFAEICKNSQNQDDRVLLGVEA